MHDKVRYWSGDAGKKIWKYETNDSKDRLKIGRRNKEIFKVIKIRWKTKNIRRNNIDAPFVQLLGAKVNKCGSVFLISNWGIGI